jgi:hypothetical protein
MGDVIATADFVAVLSTSAFPNWTASPVIKHRIVRCEWEGSGEVQRECDFAGPEDVILNGDHDVDLAEMMGDLFELVLPVGCLAQRVCFSQEDEMWNQLNYYSFEGGDLFFAMLPGGRRPICSERFKLWIESQPDVARWIRFIRVHFRHAQ